MATCVLALTLAAGNASAQSGFLYGGVHPINPVAGGGFCYTSVAHDHPYPIDPSIAYLYRSWNGYNYFVGNPYHFGYQGQAFPYYGHHPLPDCSSYCYLDGAHYHHFVPAVSLASYYVVNNGYYYYNGVLPPAYYTYQTTWYRPRHTYYYLPTYRTYYSTYRTTWRTYAAPASVTYITRPPTITYRYTTPPVRTWNTTVVRTTPTPTYRYNVNRPNTYNTYYRPPVRTTTTTTVRPSGSVTRRTTVTRTWRR